VLTNGDVASSHHEPAFTARQGMVFATCVVLSFCFGPASGGALQLLLGPIRAHDASWITLPVWVTAFLFGGACAGNALTGRRGRFPFSMAFLIFPLAAVAVIGQSLAFHDNYRWRPYEHVLDFALFNVAYAMAFAAMAWVSTIMLTRCNKAAWSAAAACSLNGMVGGAVFSLATRFLPLRGRVEAISFVASLAIPGFLSARRISATLTRNAPDLQ
jgi:hypothetical protein